MHNYADFQCLASVQISLHMHVDKQENKKATLVADCCSCVSGLYWHVGCTQSISVEDNGVKEVRNSYDVPIAVTICLETFTACFAI